MTAESEAQEKCSASLGFLFEPVGQIQSVVVAVVEKHESCGAPEAIIEEGPNLLLICVLRFTSLHLQTPTDSLLLRSLHKGWRWRRDDRASSAVNRPRQNARPRRIQFQLRVSL